MFHPTPPTCTQAHDPDSSCFVTFRVGFKDERVDSLSINPFSIAIIIIYLSLLLHRLCAIYLTDLFATRTCILLLYIIYSTTTDTGVFYTLGVLTSTSQVSHCAR